LISIFSMATVKASDMSLTKYINRLFNRHKQAKKEPGNMITIKRYLTGDDGTAGVLFMKGFGCYTLELPWRYNEPCVSCIRPGVYSAIIDNNTIIGGQPVIRFYDDQFDKERYGILIHIGNYAGDKDKGFRSDVQGCICVGMGTGTLSNQRAVTSSRAAMTELLANVKEGAVAISIENIYET